MKNLIQNFRTVLLVGVILGLTQFASAATKKFAIAISPGSTNVLDATATNVTATLSFTSTGGSFTGVITNTVSVSPAGQGVTASFSGASVITTSNSPTVPSSGSAVTMTLYLSATAGATPDTLYTVTVAGTNAAATGISGFAVVTYRFTVGTVPTTIWTAASGTDLNWSTAGNWSLGAAPNSLNDVKFFDTAANPAAGTVDNTVDGNITIKSLTYGQTNNYHTTQIASGKTLTVGGLAAGTGVDNGASLATTNAITGAGGTLAMANPAANISIAQGASGSGSTATNRANLDMSGLDTFTATPAGFFVGVDQAIGIKGASGNLLLAKTNTITLTPFSAGPQFAVGDNSGYTGETGNPVASPASILLLGQTNAIFADSIAVGRGKAAKALMGFNSAFTAPYAYFRGTNGSSSRVGIWVIGDSVGVGSSEGSATNDFSSGTVNALVGTMYVGKGSSSTGTNNGTLTFGAGTIDVNTLEVGYSVTGVGRGTVNVNGGTLQVNTSLELAHGNNSVGALNVSGATVTVNSGITVGAGAAAVSVSGSGSLSAANSNATIGTTANPLGSFSVTNSTFILAVQSAAPSVTANTLSAGAGSVNTINVSSVPTIIGAYPGQFPVIKYTVSGGDLTTFVLGTLPGSFQGYLSNNTASGSIDLVLTNGPAPTAVYTWDGVTSGDWDTTTANWLQHSGASAGSPVVGSDTNYVQGSYVTFDDTLTGTGTVNLTTTLTPITLTVSNTANNYIFTGSGHISGPVGLSKQGAGTLTLAGTGGDNFSGGISAAGGTLIVASDESAVTGSVAASGGTLQVGNGGTAGLLPAGVTVQDNTALIFDRSDNLTVTNSVTGAGTLTQDGPGILTLAGTNTTFLGSTIAAQGTLQAGNTNNPLGLGAVVVSNNATLDINGQALYGGGSAPAVTIAGAGVGGNGAIVNNGPSLTKALHAVTLAADATFGGTSNWDIRNSSGSGTPPDASLTGGFNLTKVGAGTVQLRGVTVDPTLGNITVQAGGLTFSSASNAPIASLGDPGSNLTVYANGTVTFDSMTNVPAKNIVLTNGATVKSLGTNTITSPVILAGTTNSSFIIGTGAELVLASNLVSGTAGLAKSGSGTLVLSGTNTYTGGTTVSGGTLAVVDPGSISNTPSISVSAGALFDVSGVSSGFILGDAAQTLSGSGSVNGAITVGGNGTIAPGSGTATIGTLTLSNAPTLAGAIVMKVNSTNAQTADSLAVAAGTLTYGGTLTVNNKGPIPAAGTVFTLFNAPGYAGAFSSVTLPAPGAVHWNTNNLAVNGTLQFVNTAPVAGADNVTHNSGAAIKVTLASLLANDTDADGDTLTITAIDSTTTGGATLALNGASVATSTLVIIPASAAEGDTFTYTVSDGYGGTAVGTVTIHVGGVNGQAQSLTVTGGTATVSFAGIPGYSYEVQRADDVNFTVNVTTLVTTNAPSTGSFIWTDTTATGPTAFYRLVYPAPPVGPGPN